MSGHPLDHLAALTVVEDGDAYVIGNPATRCYVAVPHIGAQVIAWLCAGDDLDTAAARAEQVVGEPVDIAGFLEVLESEGVLESAPVPGGRPIRAGLRRAGRVLFSPLGWLVQGALAVSGLVALAREPSLRPQPADLGVLDSPLASVLVMLLSATVCSVLHEAGHVLAAAAHGVPCRLSLGRRMYLLTAQADLTALWGLPRSKRLPPLLAGLMVDGAVTGGLLLAQMAGIPVALARVFAATVVLQVAAMSFQAAVFMRTDLYAVLATLSGCRNLWLLKSAVLRRLLHRATREDEALLESGSRRDWLWARGYLAVYLPGLAVAGWCLIAMIVPGLRHVAAVATESLQPFDLSSARTWDGVATITLVVSPTAGTIITASVAGVRSLAVTWRRSSSA